MAPSLRKKAADSLLKRLFPRSRSLRCCLGSFGNGRTHATCSLGMRIRTHGRTECARWQLQDSGLPDCSGMALLLERDRWFDVCSSSIYSMQRASPTRRFTSLSHTHADKAPACFIRRRINPTYHLITLILKKTNKIIMHTIQTETEIWRVGKPRRQTGQQILLHQDTKEYKQISSEGYG